MKTLRGFSFFSLAVFAAMLSGAVVLSNPATLPRNKTGQDAAPAIDFRSMSTDVLLQTAEHPPALSAPALAAEINNRGWLALTSGDSASARARFNTALRLHAHPAAVTGLARLDLMERKSGEARLRIRALAPRDRPLEAWFVLTEAARLEGDWETWDNEINRARLWFPADPELRRQQGLCNDLKRAELSRERLSLGTFTLSFPQGTGDLSALRYRSLVDDAVESAATHWPVRNLPPLILTFDPDAQTHAAAQTRGRRIQLPLLPLQSDADARHLRMIIIHELAHASMDSLAPGLVPEWLHEGLALWSESPRDVEEAVALNPDQVPWARFQEWGEIGRTLSPDATRFMPSVAKACAQKLLQQQGFDRILTWIRALPSEARGDRTVIARSFEKNFRTSLKQLYAEVISQ